MFKTPYPVSGFVYLEFVCLPGRITLPIGGTFPRNCKSRPSNMVIGKIFLPGSYFLFALRLQVSG